MESSGTKFLQVYFVSSFEERVLKSNLSRFKVAYGLTHLTNHVQLIQAYKDRVGNNYQILNLIDKMSFVVLTNVEITSKGVRLTHASKVNLFDIFKENGS